ncbi:MAG: bifunctional diguanylate cyclase/phosphodiesterase, partial [Gemmatimonadota bacterium]|nr:bifunctional diguanylate cyclase/phosphodiesterase [Gemmatimonadota bacterium]
LENRALHDYLTGLPNRALFADRLKHALRRGRRDGDYVALLYVDLDRFKPINDRAGHAVGDEILREVSARLRTVVRDADTVARLGGDEFALLLETVGSETQAITAAERIVTLVRTPVVVDGEEHQVGASVGIAISSAETREPDDLVHQADLAMYEAKRRGGFQHRLYTPELEQLDTDWSIRLEADLRRAIERSELELEYQPIVDTKDRAIVGVEALVRWSHPDHGPLLPASFIPIAEESSLVAELDRWVLERGCREIRRLIEFGVIHEPFSLSVNLSARHFEEPDFIDAISDILLRTRFDPDDLQLEITESAAGNDMEKVCALKKLGVRVAIDDFGTGFSSLSYLQDLDVDVLKVDKSFVLALGADPASIAIVRTIMTLADMLDLGVIVEGIEDAGQLVHLEDLGGSLVQGYLFGRPVTAAKLPALVSKGIAESLEDGDRAAPEPDRERPTTAEAAPAGVPAPQRRWGT